MGDSQPSGILPGHWIQDLAKRGQIRTPEPFVDGQVQPASLDLRLGPVAYRVRASFLPGPGTTVAERIEALKLHEIDLTTGALLEPGRSGGVYIVPLMEALALPDDVAAATNPKSSTGRLDVFTRVITDRAREFDTIPAGYAGQLYLEISPRTFPIIVRAGSRLSQVRFRRGNARLDDTALRAVHAETPLVDDDLRLADGVMLSIDLGREGVVGYRAKRHTGLIDVDRRDAYDVIDFWDPLTTHGREELVLDPDQFYILVSNEAVHVPPDYAAEMVPYDPLVGEFRVHYAGFFDPGFGHSPAGGAGSRAVLEVRSHEVPFILEHGQSVGRLVYERMLERPQVLYGQDIGSHYQAQGLKLSKHFRAT
ncbi:2'-deoxycytidine 5'-triphosphate deaminase [Bauldia sp.]|uniref:2'-deoxycytidine 5'-triphosphate deaminase n=1 Tax=Bauldia sp. TaxID=2575872 RepID=UPI003BACDE88